MSASPPLVVPLNPVASQTLSVTLAGQACTIAVYGRSIEVPVDGGIPSDPFPQYRTVTPVFLDLYVSDALVIGGVLCRDRNLIVRSAYLGFVGDLAFFDAFAGPTVPATDPVVGGLGTQYLLVYLPDAV